MSAAIVESNIQQNLCHEYHAEWELSNLLSLKNKRIKTPAFYPVPNLDLKFCYEAYFQLYRISSSDYSIFKSSIVKLGDTTVSPSMKLQIDMKVCYKNGTLFKEYRDLSPVSVKEMDYFYFDDVTTIFRNNCNQLYEHGIAMVANDYLIVNCHMKIFDTKSPCLSCPGILCSLRALNISSEDIKSLIRSDDKSDLVIRVGGKSFFAHKAVLIAQAPVFKQMLLTDSEFGSGIIVVNDSTSEAFDRFLDYLYLGDFDNKSWSTVKDLYVLSVKYEVSSLKQACSSALGSHLSASNVCEILGIAFDYGDVELKETVTKFVAKCVGNN